MDDLRSSKDRMEQWNFTSLNGIIGGVEFSAVGGTYLLR